VSTNRETPRGAAPARTGAGRVKAVRGAVLDIEFEPGTLPAIDDAVTVFPADLPPVVAEVQAHLGGTAVRALALQSTAGLRRGATVSASGKPVDVPVGDGVLGRLLDVVGETRDGGPAGRRGPARHRGGAQIRRT
jgi:F-type H+/Na+-transporting ATPase subunit beta